MAIIKQQYEGWAVVKYVKALNSGKCPTIRFRCSDNGVPKAVPVAKRW